MVKKIDPKESQLFEEIQELCTLCAKAIVKISDDTGYPPGAVAKFFVEIFQHILKSMDEGREDK